MSRKGIRNAKSLKLSVLFNAALTLALAFTALGQQADKRQASAKSPSVYVRLDAKSPGALQSVSPTPRGVQRTSRGRSASSVAPGSGNTLFMPAVSYDIGATGGGSGILAVAVGDLNGDGKPDLAVTAICPSINPYCDNGIFPTGNGTVQVLLGNGDGTFQSPIGYDSGGITPSSVAIADVNGDGKPDLLVANECKIGPACSFSSVSVLLGNGDGSFHPAGTYHSGGYQQGPEEASVASIAVGDVNGDGKPDLVVTNECVMNGCTSGTVGVLLGNGDGTFQPAVIYRSGGDWPNSVALADVNGDGKLDIVVANCGPVLGSGCASGEVGVLLNKGDGTFYAPVSYRSGGVGALSVAVADVNGDGKLDLAVANLCSSKDGVACLRFATAAGSVTILLGNGDGTFQPAVSYYSGRDGAHSVAVADVNGDGKPDLVVSGCDLNAGCGPAVVGVLLGNGNGIFQRPIVYSAGCGASFTLPLVVADLNGDGKPDAAVGNGCDGASSDSSAGVLLNSTGP